MRRRRPGSGSATSPRLGATCGSRGSFATSPEVGRVATAPQARVGKVPRSGPDRRMTDPNSCASRGWGGCGRVHAELWYTMTAGSPGGKCRALPYGRGGCLAGPLQEFRGRTARVGRSGVPRTQAAFPDSCNKSLRGGVASGGLVEGLSKGSVDMLVCQWLAVSESVGGAVERVDE